jgi:hypothetical protein
MNPIHDSSIGYPALLDLLKKLPPRENTQPINMIYGETILFEDRTANYGLEEFVDRVKQLKEKLTQKPQHKKAKTLRSIIVIAEDQEEEIEPEKSLQTKSDIPSKHTQTSRLRRNKPTVTTHTQTQKKKH